MNTSTRTISYLLDEIDRLKMENKLAQSAMQAAVNKITEEKERLRIKYEGTATEKMEQVTRAVISEDIVNQTIDGGTEILFPFTYENTTLDNGFDSGAKMRAATNTVDL